MRRSSSARRAISSISSSDNSTVSKRDVVIGPADGKHTVITSGLGAGEKVVIDGVDRLRDGAKVKVVDSPPAAGGSGPSQRGVGRQGGGAAAAGPANGEGQTSPRAATANPAPGEASPRRTGQSSPANGRRRAAQAPRRARRK